MTADRRTDVEPGGNPWFTFVGRVLIVTAVALVVALSWYATRVLLLAFAGALLGLLFNAMASWFQRRLRLRYAVSLALALLLLTMVLVGFGWLIGERIGNQAAELAKRLPESWSAIQSRLTDTQWGRWIEFTVRKSPGALGRQDLVSQLTNAVSAATAFVAGVLVVIFVGVYLAASPKWYLDGIVQLVPLPHRERFRVALHQTGHALRRWLVAQLIAMVAVGVAIGVGLWLIGVPLALSLGLLAFLFELIPNVGPILAAVPALLVAWTQGVNQVLLVLLLYVAVQGLESYVVLPLLQQKAVRLPPALSLLSLVLFGLLGGILGVLVAAPLTVAVIVLVKSLYVKGALGDSNESLPGNG